VTFDSNTANDYGGEFYIENVGDTQNTVNLSVMFNNNCADYGVCFCV